MSFEKTLIGKQYAAIEIFPDNNRDRFSYLEAEQKKNELIITKQKIFDNLEELFELKTKRPTALVINNYQVLTKEIVSNEVNEKKIIHQAFPNLKIDDFFCEIWRKDNLNIISISRKSYVDEILHKLKDFNIIGISLGVCSISSVMQFSIPEILYTNHQVIATIHSDKTLLQLNEKHEEEFIINGLPVSNSGLLPFCSILKLPLNLGNTGGNILELNSSLLENFKQESFFSKGLVTGIIVIVGILLINFFLFTFYFDKTRKITEELSLNSSNVEASVKTKERINDKEQKLQSFSVSDKSRSSVIVNDIVKVLPSSILLSELEFHPLEKKIKEQEAIITSDSIITLSGTTISNEAFTGWISRVEKNHFVKNVTINSFGKNDSNKTEFKIRINLK